MSTLSFLQSHSLLAGELPVGLLYDVRRIIAGSDVVQPVLKYGRVSTEELSWTREIDGRTLAVREPSKEDLWSRYLDKAFPAELTIPKELDRVSLEAILRDTIAQLRLSNAALTVVTNELTQEWAGDPGRLLNVTEFGALLDVSDEAIRQRHQAGKLIAVLKDGRERGRGYPVFQSWAGVRGTPLEETLQALGYAGPSKMDGLDATQAYQFFVSRHELLGGLTPVQVLTGVGADVADQEANEFLEQPESARLDFVKKVAASTVERLSHA